MDETAKLAMLIIASIALVSINASFWGPYYLRFTLRMKRRNKKFSEYLKSPYFPFNAVHQDVFDYELYSKIERRSTRREYFADRGLIVSQLSKKINRDIQNRYVKPLDYAYKRAGKLLLMSPNQRRYLGLDEETESLIAEVKKNYPIRCLQCNDSGQAAMAYDAPRFEGTCECCKKEIINIL